MDTTTKKISPEPEKDVIEEDREEPKFAPLLSRDPRIRSNDPDKRIQRPK